MFADGDGGLAAIDDTVLQLASHRNDTVAGRPVVFLTPFGKLVDSVLTQATNRFSQTVIYNANLDRVGRQCGFQRFVNCNPS